MITASVVLFNTKIDQIQNVIDSYRPSNERLLYFLDNSLNRNAEYECLNTLEGVTYFSNKGNLGYGKAHNIGIEKGILAGSKYHIVLNPDIRFKPDVINKLIEFADSDENILYILPKVLYPNGELQYLCKLLPTPMDLIFRRFLPQIGWIKKMNDRYTLKSSGYNKIINPPCLSGCFMFMRTEALENYSLRFDDRFFMYCEDFDLIRRLHRYGKTLFYPEVEIIHDHAQGSYKNKTMLKMHVKSAVKYFNKYGWFFDNERKKMNKRILQNVK